MTLQWSGFTSSPNGAVAYGLRGRYTINWLAGRYVLTGYGYDDLSMVLIPPWGRQFDDVTAAQAFAEKVEQVRTVEPQASGA